MNELALPKTLLEFCEVRVRVLNKVSMAYRFLEEADTDMRSYYTHGLGYETRLRKSIEEVAREVDRDLWHAAFDKTGFMQLMDTEAKKKFMAELADKPPEFNEGNIRSTFMSLWQEKDDMYARGIVNVFLCLSKQHKTNNREPFKVNERAILSYMCEKEWNGGRVHVNYSHAGDRLNDIDRVFKTLDEQKHEPRALEHGINNAFKTGETPNYYADDYFEIRGFLNGNMHIHFKRTDLLEKANRIIHDYYHGQALAAGPQ